MRLFARRVSPALVLGLTLLWLLLNQSVSPGHIVLGALLGTLLAWAGSTLRPVRVRVRRIDVALALLLLVLLDVIRSNFHIARVVLGLTGRRPIRSDFLQIPIRLKDPHGLAVLATILTATPGTVWVGLSADGTLLTIHVLDLQDERYWVRMVQQRYERRLLRIFE